MDYMIDFSAQFVSDFAFQVLNYVILACISPFILFASLFVEMLSL